MDLNCLFAVPIGVVFYRQSKTRFEYTENRSFSALSFRLHSEQAKFRYRDKTLPVRAGDICLVPQNLEYRRSAKEEEIIVFHFHALTPVGNEILVISPKDPERYRSLFFRALTVWEEKKSGYRSRTAALFYEILADLQAEDLVFSEDQNEIALAAAGLLEQNLRDPSCSVEQVARMLSISPSYLRKKFKEEFGIGPLQHLIRCRIREAEWLLRSDGRNQNQIAEKCGFSDVKYFRNAFKRVTGKTPKQFAALSKAAEESPGGVDAANHKNRNEVWL